MGPGGKTSPYPQLYGVTHSQTQRSTSSIPNMDPQAMNIIKTQMETSLSKSEENCQ